MNLALNKKADYIITGNWANKAYKEAEILGDPKIVASSKDKTFSYIPDCSDLPIRDDASYVYICENNTIYGTKFPELPHYQGPRARRRPELDVSLRTRRRHPVRPHPCRRAENVGPAASRSSSCARTSSRMTSPAYPRCCASRRRLMQGRSTTRPTAGVSTYAARSSSGLPPKVAFRA